ncbi:hypothetical protein ABTM92_19790, partial [Acinetobacter baumannii]
MRQYNYGLGLISVTDVDLSTHSRSSLFYLIDGLGSTSELTSESGVIQVSYLYDAWGNVVRTEG